MSDSLALCYLIKKCPSVLTAEEIDPFICFVRDELEAKIEPAQLKRVLTTADPRFLLYVLALCLRSVEEIDRTVAFLSRYGGIDLIVRRPVILNYDLDGQLIPRIKVLVKLSGADEDATGNVLRKFLAILNYTVKHTEGHVEFLRSFVGLTDPEIFKIFRVFPSVVSASRERKLRPRIEFLKQCGLETDDI
ncbi:hypothetical protein CJ030_MR6G016563 [Morella rubra]|uniref:Uncharacterized protein n=1 Tax=Morella rubra TaxID=262757 RepID=A0A6A1V939_9ROSI|nr:hypothetical protein CJ030_MR6G016563 [Morella rubra]